MDDAVVEDDMDNMEEIRNIDPELLTTTVSSVSLFLQLYGWYLLLAVGIICYLYSKYRKVQSITNGRQSDMNLHRYDVEEVQKKHEGLAAARQRLQERYSMDASRHKEEEMVREDEKRRERLADWERHKEGKGYRSKKRIDDPSQSTPSSSGPSSAGQTKKKIYKVEDYNPLSGSYGGSSYRPPARFGGGGG